MDHQDTTPDRSPLAPRRRPRRWGALAGSLAVVGGLAGGGAVAFAAEPAPPAAPAADAASASAGGQAEAPDGSGDAQDAFWGAGYTSGDAYALVELWQTDISSAKERVGRALQEGHQPPAAGVVDGEQPVPWAPGTYPEPSMEEFYAAQWEAFDEAGYTDVDVKAVADLWDWDVVTTEDLMARAVFYGQDVPVEPSGTPGDE